MIQYLDILTKLKQAGYSTTRLRQEKILSEKTIQQIRTGKPITTETINKICTLINCPVQEIIQYKKD